MNRQRTVFAQIVNNAPNELSVILAVIFALEWSGGKIVIHNHLQFIVAFSVSYVILKVILTFVVAFLKGFFPHLGEGN